MPTTTLQVPFPSKGSVTLSLVFENGCHAFAVMDEDFLTDEVTLKDVLLKMQEAMHSSAPLRDLN